MDAPDMEGQGETFLKADEIDDEDGPSKIASMEASGLAQNEARNELDFSVPADVDVHEDIVFDDGNAHDKFALPRRPPLTRELSVPAPLQPPPPPPSEQQQMDEQGYPTDSLSLIQLRKLVTDMPKVEPTPYAFKYQDASEFGEEIEEWFEYNMEERAMLLKAQSSFVQLWQAFNKSAGFGEYAYVEGKLDWCSANEDSRSKFLMEIKTSVEAEDREAITTNLMCLTYIALGLWNETAGIVSGSINKHEQLRDTRPRLSDIGAKYEKSFFQIRTIRESLYMLHETVGFQTIFAITRKYCAREWDVDEDDKMNVRERGDVSNYEIRCRRWCSLTILYMALEVVRQDILLEHSTSLQRSIIRLGPSILSYFTALIARLRWEDPVSLPLSKILLFYWKSILVVLGGISKVEKMKTELARTSSKNAEGDVEELITASPLDYHLFRQEITSKYPAFNPPPPLFAFEPETSSILPPLQGSGARSRLSLRQEQRTGPPGVDGTGTSILHQPVHIATPAPSPPPSPAGPGGKLGKKQNYQTNQMFPFLYPPLVPSSNDLGGKGSTETQDLLVGRRWEGSDIPASILEAADLFANRMRATRAMRQLWAERIRYMKYERGYEGISTGEFCNDINDSIKSKSADLADERAGIEEDSCRRLDTIEEFYDQVLPDLQSVVIVLLKVLLTTVTNLVTQGNIQDGLATGFQSPDTSNPNGGGLAEVNGINGANDKTSDTVLKELDAIRSQEITGKAVSAILLLLLKWFKLSHILKFEYLSQLLLDSNYIQLILKLFTHQELERAVNYKCERKQLNFFQFCRTHSRHGQGIGSSAASDVDSDDAIPPPIKLRREDDNPKSLNNSLAGPMRPPSVDELGYPISDVPVEPITDFSWRNFFSSINYLRVMQKVCKHKAHRNLLMVQYKYSNILKKSLKVPQPDIRLYTLKIIKGQVPYCNRKWRAANMRIITAIYLHCRPELRDDWLAGIDVDAEMMEALPQEQAVRALTYWYNIKRYPDRMGVEKGVLEKEQDFFLKELDNLGSEGDGSIDADGEDGSMDEHRWEGALQMDWQ